MVQLVKYSFLPKNNEYTHTEGNEQEVCSGGEYAKRVLVHRVDDEHGQREDQLSNCVQR